MDNTRLSKQYEDSTSEREPLIGDYDKDVKTFVYTRRWCVLAVFSLACMAQAMVWNTWGPIAESLVAVFGWSDGIIALLPNINNITFFLLVIPGGILMDTKGLRFSMVLCMGLLVVCTAIRCFTLEPSVFTPLAFVSGLMHGLTSIMPFTAPPLVSAIWFPVEERPMATAIGTVFNYVGVAIEFIIGPQLVPGPIYGVKLVNNYTANELLRNESDGSDRVVNLQDLQSGISNLMYTHVGIAVFLFGLVLIYFPDKPPRSPSVTASIQRTDYKVAVVTILKNKPLWVIIVAGALPIGVSDTWIAVIDIILKDVGVSQVDAGWMGFLNLVFACLVGIFIARFSTVFHRRRKVFLTILFICAAVCVVWFALICGSFVGYSLPSLYISCVLIGIFINGTTPLFYEMTAEASFPVGEGVTAGFYTCAHDIFGSIFLFLVNVPGIGVTWLNWVVLGCLCVSIPLLVMFPERYKRSDIDMKIEQYNQAEN